MTTESMDRETDILNKYNFTLKKKNQQENKLHPPLHITRSCFDGEIQTWNFLTK